jgi:hypothetical protein
MLRHEFSFEMPHSAARLWALFQDAHLDVPRAINTE